MENFEKDFLKDKYWTKKEFREATETSVEKKQRLEPNDALDSQKPQDKIPHYLDRIQNIAERKGKLFKEQSLYPEHIIKPESISDDYIKGIFLGNFAEQKGYERDHLKNEEIRKQVLAQFKEETGQNFDTYRIPEEEREKVVSMIVKDQTARLDTWFDYLASPEAAHTPQAFRYWAFAEMLKLGNYDEKRKMFNVRTETTNASFPELDQQALSIVFDEVRRKRTSEPSQLRLEDESRQVEFQKILQSENFGRLYAFALAHVNSLRLPTERLIITKGEWRTFPKGSAPENLTTPLQGFSTKWCIAGEGYAEGYLAHSDVLIYFSEDADGQNTIPRACIVSGENGITEVRGIISNEDVKQHLDGYITPLVAEKLRGMPGGENWQGSMEDMKQLARIHFKHLQGEAMNKDDLTFLYEVDKSIQSTGYGRDPRIAELHADRKDKLEEDMLVVFECTREEIAHVPSQINENTKAYVGQLEPGIFQKLPENLEHVYTSFPEKKIRRDNVEIGGKSAEQLISEMKAAGINISGYAKSMLKNREFVPGKNSEKATLIRITVADLGFKSSATTDQVYERAQILGLELCPADTGPNYRLKYRNQPLNEWIYMGMKQITTGSGGSPSVFELARVGGLRLRGRWARSDGEWFPGPQVRVPSPQV